MGWYTNYEVEFEKDIDWSDHDVNKILPYTVQHLYLRDLELPRLMLSIYSHSSIEEILIVLTGLYSTGMRYRIYDKNEEWTTFTPSLPEVS